MCSNPVFALETDNESEEEESALEEVHVTGTRVRRSNLDAPSPVVVIDAEQLADNGITALGEFARYLPQNANSISDSRANNSTLSGAAAFNLRGIGTDATLTLVNGRRIAPYGNSGDSAPFVDINAIPVSAIERIEVLKDGASAIYGSEAVAGVVNIITRRSVDQVTAEAGFLTSSEGDGDEWDASITGGWNGPATQFVGTLSWLDRNVIWSRDRKFSSETDLRSVGGFNGRSQASSPPTIILQNPTRIVVDPECPPESAVASRSFEPLPNGTPRTLCRFNYAQFTMLQAPSERWGATAMLHHEFPGLTFFAEAIYSHNETQTVLAPNPLANFSVRADHPDNPFDQNMRLFYRLLDGGARGFENTSTTWRLVGGLQGEVGNWDWEAALVRSEGRNDNTRFNGILVERFQQALLGLGGPNGNQYYNPFGLHPQNPPEVLDQILISGTGTVLTSTETSADFTVSGHSWDLPGGPLGIALGGQWREIGLDQVADPEELTGVIAGSSGILPLIEDRSIVSVFAEFVLPLLESLEAQVAVRWDDYSDFGSTTNPKIGLGWRPWEDFLLRATWGTSFRPPTFRELYDPLFEIEDGFVASDDPWRCPVTGSPNDCLAIFAPGFTAGNPNLKPDEGESWLLGFAWEPGSLPGLSLALELWKFEHSNRIVFSDEFFYEMLEGIPPYENPFVERAPPTAEDQALGIPGVITAANATYINASEVDTSGLDLSVTYQWDTASLGDFQVQLDYTYLDEYLIGLNQFGLELQQDRAGKYLFPGNGLASGMPRNRGNLSLGWNYGQHAVTSTYRYSNSYYSPINVVIGRFESDTPFEVDAYDRIDLQYRYRFSALLEAELRLGCQNCTNNDPPVYNYTETVEPFHEGRGILWYARWSQPF